MKKEAKFCSECGNRNVLIDNIQNITYDPKMLRDNNRLLIEKRGANGTLRVFSDFVEIDRTSSRFVAGLIAGLHGVKRIYFRDIGSIQKEGYCSWMDSV